MTPRLLAVMMTAVALFLMGGALSDNARAGEVLIPRAAVREKDSSSPQLFVVAIGVGTFHDPFWPGLKWPERDATRVAAAFGRKTDWQPVVTLMTGASVTLKSIQKALLDLARKARRQDAVALYISTHGTLAIGGHGDLEPILVLPDTKSNDLVKTGLSESTLRAWLDRIPTSRKLMIIAACHSGLGKSRLTPRVQEILSSHKGRASRLEDVSEGFFVMSAAARGETAREDDRLQGDVYTYYFLEALKVFDRNRDGAVSALEAHDYARDHAYAKTDGKQRATLEAQSIGSADLILHGRVTHEARPIFEARGEELAGLMVSVDGGEKGRLPTAFALSPAKSEVQLFRVGQSKPLATYEIAAPSGARVELEDLLSAQPWSLGIEYGLGFFQAKATQRIIQSPLRRVGLVTGYRIFSNFALGFSYSKIDSPSRSIRSNVKATVQWDVWEVRGEYVYSHLSMQGVTLGAGIGVGRAKARLLLVGGDDELSYRAQSTTLTPYVYGEWSPRSGIDLRLSGRYAMDRYDFGDPGPLNALRLEPMLHLVYRFGGYVRRQ